MGNIKNFKIINMTSDSIKLFIECFNINGSTKELNRTIWQYFDNPVKSSVVKIAYDNNKERTAGIYAISCLKFKIGSDIVVASQSMDTITDINYRGQGLFVDLAVEVYNNAVKSNIKLVYGFPNGKSVHGFIKHLNWRLLDPVPFLIKPLRSKYFLRKNSLLNLLPNIVLPIIKRHSTKYKIFEKLEVPDDANKIWQEFSKSINVSIVRDKEYLLWRYINKPNENYRIAHCYDDNNNYLGYIIYSIKNKHDGIIGYIMELIYDPNYPDVAKDLLRYASNDLAKNKADCILAWSLEHSPNFKTFRKQFFFKMPARLRPIELHFGVLSLDTQIESIISDRKNWYLSYSDSDTV